jgi:hypothetical protein
MSMQNKLIVLDGGVPLADLNKAVTGLYHAFRTRIRDPLRINFRDFNPQNKNDVICMQQRILYSRDDLRVCLSTQEHLAEYFSDLEDCAEKENVPMLAHVARGIVEECKTYGASVIKNAASPRFFMQVPTHPDFNNYGDIFHFRTNLDAIESLVDTINTSPPYTWKTFVQAEEYRSQVRRVRDILEYQGY